MGISPGVLVLEGNSSGGVSPGGHEFLGVSVLEGISPGGVSPRESVPGCQSWRGPVLGVSFLGNQSQGVSPGGDQSWGVITRESVPGC